jgi:hypothetical protein
MQGAGGGRPLKPDGQKQNRNATKAEIVLPSEGRQGPIPDSPLALRRKAAKEQWERLWRTPEATTWGDVDLLPIARMVILQTDPATLADTKLLQQVRDLEDRFLLSPYSRRINKVSIAPQSERTTGRASSSDMKKRLRVVGS